MNRKGIIEPMNVIMGILAIAGAILIILGYGNYGLIFLIFTTLIEAIMRVMK